MKHGPQLLSVQQRLRLGRRRNGSGALTEAALAAKKVLDAVDPARMVNECLEGCARLVYLLEIDAVLPVAAAAVHVRLDGAPPVAALQRVVRLSEATRHAV